MNRNFWKGKRVFITGHTGFKGGWLSLWLANMGAEVVGFSQPPPSNPSFFNECKIESIIKKSILGDIREVHSLTKAIQSANPEIVMHMAAQSLVRHSYAQPVETFAVNVMGTVNVFEAIRQTPGIRAAVNVTSDKCYENHEQDRPYKEHEPMGGYDPYSCSKGCSELVTAAYRRSFFEASGIALASVRAGNVIGGGDWAADRLIPDIFRAVDADETLIIRSPDAVRPWQHVLEPLSGYLTLAEKLYSSGDAFAEAWNFGPDKKDMMPVRWIIDYLNKGGLGFKWRIEDKLQPHEASCLKLDSAKAFEKLGWKRRLNLKTALDMTLEWRNEWKKKADMAAVGIKQIMEYEKRLIL